MLIVIRTLLPFHPEPFVMLRFETIMAPILEILSPNHEPDLLLLLRGQIVEVHGGSLFCETNHVPIMAGSYKVRLFLLGKHKPAQHKTAEALDVHVGIGEVEQLP